MKLVYWALVMTLRSMMFGGTRATRLTQWKKRERWLEMLDLILRRGNVGMAKSSQRIRVEISDTLLGLELRLQHLLPLRRLLLIRLNLTLRALDLSQQPINPGLQLTSLARQTTKRNQLLLVLVNALVLRSDLHTQQRQIHLRSEDAVFDQLLERRAENRTARLDAVWPSVLRLHADELGLLQGCQGFFAVGGESIGQKDFVVAECVGVCEVPDDLPGLLGRPLALFVAGRDVHFLDFGGGLVDHGFDGAAGRFAAVESAGEELTEDRVSINCNVQECKAGSLTAPSNAHPIGR